MHNPLRKFDKDDEMVFESILKRVLEANGSIADFKKQASGTIRRTMVGQPIHRIEETVNQSRRKIDALVNKIKSQNSQDIE